MGLTHYVTSRLSGGELLWRQNVSGQAEISLKLGGYCAITLLCRCRLFGLPMEMVHVASGQRVRGFCRRLHSVCRPDGKSRAARAPSQDCARLVASGKGSRRASNRPKAIAGTKNALRETLFQRSVFSMLCVLPLLNRAFRPMPRSAKRFDSNSTG
jgi:hypothetical protein